MNFSRILNNVSNHYKEGKTLFLFKKSGFCSLENKFVIRKGKIMKEEDGIINNAGTYKSYKGHNLKIVYENNFFLVLNKPYDIKLEKGKYDSMYPSVETLLRQKRKNLGVMRICGQLDYATSGLLIIAKDRLSSNILNYNIECKNISKIYLAILYDHLPLDVLHVNTPISKIKNEFKMKLCYNYNDYYDNGKYCYSLIYPYKHCYLNNAKVTLCELRTITGRRHQLRLHALCLGSGIVGDETYFEDMITNKYKINYSNYSTCSNNVEINNNYEDSNKKYDNEVTEKRDVKKIEIERMMLHCWIILKNDNEIKKLEKSENINILENKIFDKDYIICDDELSKFVNEEKRTFEQCVLKNNDLINTNFINYNVKNINKNIRKINKKLNKIKYDKLLHNSLTLQNAEGAKNAKCVKLQNVNNNIEKRQVHVKNEIDDIRRNSIQNETERMDINSIDLNSKKIETINVSDRFINDHLINKNSIYLVKNEKYKDPNDLFDDIHDSVNKFNWG
ncbi:ribosomal large subunit pseudouridylate synthase, putative [Plasmodium malariae]|uniref:Ribosomal large subunit pseudouridylate synthase, putative n=1 Tax=Plasmodium malariae TaxID=5858 RepID=A0A1C3KDL2_PLAMA|nr:ribosomal large subunit pseudouridylate synthase, putative [Plasmodium malariae]